MVAALSRGMDLEGIRSLELGQLVDYCIEWNKAHGMDEKEDAPKKRKATQADWNSLLG